MGKIILISFNERNAIHISYDRTKRWDGKIDIGLTWHEIQYEKGIAVFKKEKKGIYLASYER